MLEDGHYDAFGKAFGMPMDADLTVDDTGCAFTFYRWNMYMSVPDGGTVVGDEVTLYGSLGFALIAMTLFPSRYTHAHGLCVSCTRVKTGAEFRKIFARGPHPSCHTGGMSRLSPWVPCQETPRDA